MLEGVVKLFVSSHLLQDPAQQSGMATIQVARQKWRTTKNYKKKSIPVQI